MVPTGESVTRLRQNPNLSRFSRLPGSTFQTFHSVDANTSPDYHGHALDKDNTKGHNAWINLTYIVYIILWVLLSIV